MWPGTNGSTIGFVPRVRLEAPQNVAGDKLLKQVALFPVFDLGPAPLADIQENMVPSTVMNLELTNLIPVGAAQHIAP